ncbi:dNK domain-containing protein [Cephalotus follicularis]|uniref:DNK domain-containing protein n=1 Tax=Cephalotus follicularis TaxID=3775 RepID=A0A1Q3CJS7_CEPFO|nr:dNK domain-containing protein [Cephalotus follicularis]
MQKLLCKSPYSGSGPILLCTTTTATTLSVTHPLKKFLSQGFRVNPLLRATYSAMPTAATATITGGCSSLSAFLTKRPIPKHSFYSPSTNNTSTSRCHCRCASTNTATTPVRVWLLSKEGPEPPRSGPRRVWFHTDASHGSVGEATVEGDKGQEGKVKSSAEEKPIRLTRRQKGAPLLPGNPDLLSIPGVGPRNLRKLVDNGIEAVAQLKQLYKDKFFGESSDKMVEYLQSSVGIIHKHHAESITTFIKTSVDEELLDSNSDVKRASKKRLTFCVEGNISVGKTTFLQRIANETLELRDLVEIVPEPINKWQDVGPDHFNILDAFYAEPQRYAYTFQNYVFVTRLMQERESSSGIKPLRLMERSVFSDRMVFVRAVHEANWMSEMEISIYDSWFDPVVSCLPGLIPDGFIYLRASPDTCHKRMMLRKRAEEGGVSLDYLRGLHEKHENWLFPFESGNHGVLSVSKLPLGMDSSLHPDIRDRVFYLKGDHMHSSIQKVPALVLDCEPNIDFSKDIDAKRQYARQVAEFFEFVKKKNEAQPTDTGEEAARTIQPQVLLPHKGGFWMPGAERFPGSALKSLEFRRAMSFMPS